MLRRLTLGLFAPFQTMSLTMYDDYTYGHLINVLQRAEIPILSSEEKDGRAIVVIHDKYYDGLVDALESDGFVF